MHADGTLFNVNARRCLSNGVEHGMLLLTADENRTSENEVHFSVIHVNLSSGKVVEKGTCASRLIQIHLTLIATGRLSTKKNGA